MRINEISDDEEQKGLYFLYSNFDINYFSARYIGDTIYVGGSLNILPYKKFESFPDYMKISRAVSIVLNDSDFNSFKNFPEIITDTIAVENCELTSFVGCSKAAKILKANGNKIESLDGFPESLTALAMDYHPNLELLRLFYVNNLVIVITSGKNKNIGDECTRLLQDRTLNQQQKVLKYSKWLRDNGYESNAKL